MDIPDSSIVTQNRFTELSQVDIQHGGDDVFGDWQKVVNSRKRQKVSSSDVK